MAQPNEKPSTDFTDPTRPAEERTEDRRGALRTLAVVGTIAYAGAIAVPAIGFVVPPEGAGGHERWIRVAKLADLPEGKPHRAQALGDERDAFTITRGETLGAVWLTRKGSKVSALSAVCPHLGCAIDLSPDQKGFGCPCHASFFAADGKPESGPSPRPMDPLATRITDGWVEIDFRRFRQGTTAREEIS